MIISSFWIENNKVKVLQDLVKETKGIFHHFMPAFYESRTYVTIEFPDSNSFKLFNSEWDRLTTDIVEKKSAGKFKKIYRRLLGEFKNLF